MLIDFDKFVRKIESNFDMQDTLYDVMPCHIIDLAKECEADDADTVTHGHWESINADESGYAAIYRCSVCKREISLGYFDTDCDHEYCLHCGAKMDEQ